MTSSHEEAATTKYNGENMTKAMIAGCAACVLTMAEARLVEVPLEVPSSYATGKPWAYAENSISTDRVPVKAINGSGLTELGENVWTHTYDNGHRSQAWHGMKSGDKPFATWFLVDFGEAKTFDAFRIWNGLEFKQRGLKNVDVYLSNDYEPTDRSKMEPTVASESPDFSSRVWTKALTLELNAGSETSVDGVKRHLGQTVSMGSVVTSRWFAFKINSVQGSSSDGNTGYSNICELKFFRTSAPDVVAKAVAEVSDVDAVVKGELELKPGLTAADVHVVWGMANGGVVASDWEHSMVLEGLPAGEFTALLEGLEPGSSYYVAFWTHDDGLGMDNWSEPLALTTMGEIPLSLTAPADFWEVDPRTKSFTVSVDDPFATDTLIYYSLSGSAAAAYQSGLSGLVTIPAGESSATIDFSPINNTTSAEGGETLTVSLLGTDISATVRIFDDETNPEKVLYFDNAAGDFAFETAGNWHPTDGSARMVPRFVDSVRVDTSSATSPSAPAVVTGDDGMKNLAVNNGHLRVAEGGSLVVNEVTRIGYDPGTVGSLAIDGGYMRHGTGDFSVGCEGTGTVTLAGGSIYCVGGMKIGHHAGSLGVFNLDDGVLHFNYPTSQFVGYEDGSRGELHVNGGRVELDPVGDKNYSWLRVGYNPGAVGSVTVSRGSTMTNLGYRVAIGDKGVGSWRQGGGKVEFRRLVLGNEATGVGTMVITGGTTKVVEEALTVGGSGQGYLCLTNLASEYNAELITDRQIVVGSGEGSFGRVECSDVYFHESTGGKGYGFIVGRFGHGELIARKLALKSFDKPLIIAEKEGSTGLLRGWGNINLTSTVDNNGIVVADSMGDAEGVNGFDFSRDTSKYGGGVVNSRDNPPDGTNGWYAVNRSRIKWQRVDLDLPEAGMTSRTINIGEAQDDDEIDLVNSVRLTVFDPAALEHVYAALYAPDHPDVPDPERVACAAGIWKVHYQVLGSGFQGPGFDTADLTFRYDHVKAPRGVVILHFNELSRRWETLSTVVDRERRLASVSGLRPLDTTNADLLKVSLDFFAAIPVTPGTLLIFR